MDRFGGVFVEVLRSKLLRYCVSFCFSYKSNFKYIMDVVLMVRLEISLLV